MFGCLSSFFFLRTPDQSRLLTEAREHEAREGGNFRAPRIWLKCWVLLPVAATGERDAPRPRRPGEAAPSATRRLCRPTTSRLRPPQRKRTVAPAASNRRVSQRTHGASHGAHGAFAARTLRVFRHATGATSGAQLTPLATRNRRVLRRATDASPNAQRARLSARNRRVLRRATGALATHIRSVFRRAPSTSSGAQSARLCGVRNICILNRTVLILILLLYFFSVGQRLCSITHSIGSPYGCLFFGQKYFAS